jgi:tryptophan synthase beta chain
MSETITDSQGLLKALIEGAFPDERGRFGPYGGQYVPETLMPAVTALAEQVRERLPSPEFQRELNSELVTWVGRPTALTRARHLGERWGADVWLKREDLAHTGAHKINNAIGQALLARAIGARRIVAETGAGQHGVASAAACADSAPRSCPSARATAPCARRSTRPSATGSATRPERII